MSAEAKRKSNLAKVEATSQGPEFPDAPSSMSVGTPTDPDVTSGERRSNYFLVLALMLFLGIFAVRGGFVQAVSQTLTQSNWAGGLDGGATGTLDGTWSKYFNADAGIVAGADIQSSSYTATDDGATSCTAGGSSVTCGTSGSATGGGFASGTSTTISSTGGERC